MSKASTPMVPAVARRVKSVFALMINGVARFSTELDRSVLTIFSPANSKASPAVNDTKSIELTATSSLKRNVANSLNSESKASVSSAFL